MKPATFTSYIIHFFALLHAVSSLALLTLFGDDEIVLTILTISMVVYISLLWGKPLHVAMSFAILSTFSGQYLGGLGPKLLFDSLKVFGNGVTTLAITEIIGWGLMLIVYNNRVSKIDINHRLSFREFKIPQIIFLTLSVTFYRILWAKIFGPDCNYTPDALLGFMSLTIANVPLTILLLWINVLVARYFSRLLYFDDRVVFRLICEFTFLAFLSYVSSFLANLYMVSDQGLMAVLFDRHVVVQFFSVMAFSTVIYYTAVIIIYYHRKQRAELHEHILRRNRTDYQYSRLKQQLNPHFLFNSLNVLDYLVKTDSEKASLFVHKMAEVYRYQLNQEGRDFVTLEQEFQFVESYYDMLRERFGDSLYLSVDVPEMQRSKYVVIPCSVQLLLENAAKHNEASPDKKLRIYIYLDGDKLIITNNIQPKVGHVRESSWGIGLKSIKEQYKTVFDQKIVIRNSDNNFVVELPLIEEL